MKDATSFPILLESFFTERLIAQRRASPHTIGSYRDTFRLLLQFAEKRLGKAPSKLTLEDLQAPFLGVFLDNLENNRANGPRSRNLRLTAIRSFFRYIALEATQYAGLIQRVLAIPNKRQPRPLVGFLTRPEIDALVAAPDRHTWLGRRNHALLLTVIQTGLRLSEITSIRQRDIRLGTGAHIRCEGRGRKERCAPLAKSTVRALTAWIKEQGEDDGTRILFPTMRGDRLSADAVQHLVRKYATVAQKTCPSLTGKRVSPHVLRHYVPCLTMSRNGEPLPILLGEIRSPPAKPGDMTRHSFLLAGDSSGRRGVSPRVYSDSVVHAARMFSPKPFLHGNHCLEMNLWDPNSFVTKPQGPRSRRDLANSPICPAGTSSEARARTLWESNMTLTMGLSPPARGCWSEPILCRRLLHTSAGKTGPAGDYKT